MRTRRNISVLVSLLGAILATGAWAAPARIDFDNDGHADLAIGAPLASVNGKFNAGSVTVFYGTPSGLSSAGSQLWTKDLASVPGDAQGDDLFGHSLAAADFNGDGYTDLAIGVPKVNGNLTGEVIVLFGSSNRLRGYLNPCMNPCTQPKVFTMGTIQTPSDEFGYALATGNFNMDNYADLAIGVPNYSFSYGKAPGGVRILPGGPSGLTTTNSLILTLDTPGMSGTPGPAWQGSDRFGASLVTGNFGKSAATDLAIGIPDHNEERGAVSVIYGGVTGLAVYPSGPPFDGGGNTFWTAGATLFPDVSYESVARFGFALAAGDFGNGSYEDLAIGIPGKDVGGYNDAGAVTILFGSSQGVSNTGSQQWSLGSPNVAGARQSYSRFGSSLAAADMGYGSQADLAIGVPAYDINGFADAGLVSVLFGTATGLSSNYSMILTMDSSSLQQDAQFGAALSVARFAVDVYYDLAVGLPGANVSGVNGAGAVSIRESSFQGRGPIHATSSFTATVPQPNAGFGFALSR